MGRIRFAAAAAVLAVSGCSTGGSAAAQGYSIEALLDQLPVVGDSQVLISTADLDRASEVAGVERPSDHQGDSWEQWLSAITGGEGSEVHVPLPAAANPARAAQHAEFRAATGWSLDQVGAFIEAEQPPNRFAVLQGSFGEAGLSDALGPADDGVWAEPGEDYRADLAGPRIADPLGRPVRAGLRDGQLGVGVQRGLIRAWVDSAAPTFGADEALRSVAQRLDEHDVFAAMLMREGMRVSTGALEPFDAVGVGVAVDGGEGRIVIAYAHADARTAELNENALRELASGVSETTRHVPVTDIVEFVDASSAGTTSVVVLTPLVGPSTAWNMAFFRDVFFVHR